MNLKQAFYGTEWGMSPALFQAMVAKASKDNAPRAIKTSATKGVYQIHVDGPIVKSHDFWSLIFGAVSSDELEAAIIDGQEYDGIQMMFDSGGGQVMGGASVVETIRASSVPISSHVTGMCCSQALLYASAVLDAEKPDNKFTAVSDALIGSVGVMSYFDPDEEGVVRSKNAQYKNTEESAQHTANAYEDRFILSLADHYGKTPEQITHPKSGFGQGLTFVAGEAKERGMIQEVITTPKAAPAAPTTTTNGEKMSEKTNAGAEKTVTAEQAEADKQAAVAEALNAYKAEQEKIAADAEAEKAQAKADAIVRENEIKACEFAAARPALTAELIADEDYTAALAIKTLKIAPVEAPKGKSFADSAAEQSPNIDASTVESGEFNSPDEAKMNLDAMYHIAQEHQAVYGGTDDDAIAFAKAQLAQAVA